ncbi:hypothetical protein DFH08DRAFT_847925 [Mycena albidolilacea]|uniref:Uncharacterized protein n=1 Tax=Mycena albidolilacea TaxID=1033008 RepID=A0AAD7EXU8_9AGAR|nr:hypothetical protein DFH08DRAFT_847925 [Mycena albidolilacea]
MLRPSLSADRLPRTVRKARRSLQSRPWRCFPRALCSPSPRFSQCARLETCAGAPPRFASCIVSSISILRASLWCGVLPSGFSPSAASRTILLRRQAGRPLPCDAYASRACAPHGPSMRDARHELRTLLSVRAHSVLGRLTIGLGVVRRRDFQRMHCPRHHTFPYRLPVFMRDGEGACPETGRSEWFKSICSTSRTFVLFPLVAGVMDTEYTTRVLTFLFKLHC